jgi:hypothetical protein
MKKLALLLLIMAAPGMASGAGAAEQPGSRSILGTAFPALAADSLAGDRVTLPDPGKGAVTLVVMSFKRDAQSQNDSWLGPFENEFGKKPGCFFYEVPMIRRRFVFMAPLIDGGMRAAIPGEKHKHVVTFYGDVEPYKQALNIEDVSLGYAFLLDRRGIIRWQGRGFAKPDDVKTLLETARRLALEK